MSFPLSKTMDGVPDYKELLPELLRVEAGFHTASEQHFHRRWEYSMALRAMRDWAALHGPITVAYDVGGAGSPFQHICGAQVIDPAAGGPDLAGYIVDNPRLAHVVTCLSVLEHVPDLDRFLYHLACLTAPGGLLVLTVDCVDAPYHAPDTFHFHWMRERIFTPAGLSNDLYHPLAKLGFTFFGGFDPRWHGPHVYDYAFASLVLQKRP